MILTAHQPAYLPWLGLISKIAGADACVILDNVQMSGKDSENFVNRNRILTANGPQWLTVPVRRKEGQRISEVQIASDQPWARKHWRAIELAYARAPFFERYGPSLKRLLLDREWCELAELCAATTEWLLREFEVNKPLYHVADDIALGGNELLIHLCQEFKADAFVFGKNGVDYVNRAAFKAAAVEPRFQAYVSPDPVVYSAVHYLFTRGPDKGLL